MAGSRAAPEPPPPGSYDEIVVADVAKLKPELAQRFDLILSWQVLEHVKPLDRAMDNLRSYLRPGGRLIVQLSGKLSVYALANVLLPSQLGARLIARAMPQRREPSFRAYYHRCYYTALRTMLVPWSAAEVVPRYKAGGYLAF